MKDMHHRIRVSSGTLRALSVIVSVVNTFLALRRRRGPKLSRDEIEVERGRAEVHRLQVGLQHGPDGIH